MKVLKKTVLVVVSICFIFVFSGCTSNELQEDNNRSEVIVYSPNGENVNGYKEFNDIILSTETNTETFVANKNSKKFHKSTCTSVKTIKDNNKYSTSDRRELINSGYSACQRCNP